MEMYEQKYKREREGREKEEGRGGTERKTEGECEGGKLDERKAERHQLLKTDRGMKG